MGRNKTRLSVCFEMKYSILCTVRSSYINIDFRRTQCENCVHQFPPKYNILYCGCSINVGCNFEKLNIYGKFYYYLFYDVFYYFYSYRILEFISSTFHLFVHFFYTRCFRYYICFIIFEVWQRNLQTHFFFLNVTSCRKYACHQSDQQLPQAQLTLLNSRKQLMLRSVHIVKINEFKFLMK